GQRTDVANENAAVVAELREAYEGWWRSLQPEFDRYVRIDIGGAESSVALMSHDWHTNDKGTPWHQNHVRNGYVGNGPWAMQVQKSGTYDVTLRRWPAHLGKSMGAVHARLAIAGVEAEKAIEPDATEVTFRVALERGPAMLLTTLRREDGKEHGAYFASIRSVE
ncbi:unnamed protein product, partial [Discosporangium mesarthrocarpum]